MHRSGQSLFHVLGLNQRERASADPVLFCIAAIYMSRDKNGFTYNHVIYTF